MVLVVCKRLTRRNDDTITSMCPKRVEVLHVAANNRVVRTVAYDLVLDLLPALHALLNENLRRERKAASSEITKFVRVVCET